MPSLPSRLEPLIAAVKRIMAADPFLMAAAIAYNSIFALVPLAFGAVAALSMIGSGSDGLEEIEQTLIAEFPHQVADFVTPIMHDAQDVAGSMGPIVLVASLLIALWSGSRAIYAIQKALRLIEGVEETRPYWQTRGLGILFTSGAGIALILSYVAVIFGDWLIETLRQHGINTGSVTWITIGATVVWVIALLFAIYRWGTPNPLRLSLLSAVVTTAALATATWAAAFLVPTLGGNTLAALGSVGVVLIWSYIIGLIIISVPALVPSIVDSVRGTSS